jgi:2-amino-4-hydroxy-6-hydroxymethyldihydropteridine diphosphokinase
MTRRDRVFLGLGTNLGERADHLASAVHSLKQLASFTLLSRASMYESLALGDPGGPDFLNSAVSGLWNGTPQELLAACQEIENCHGRTRPHRDAPRTLDIDILFWEGCCVATPRLTVPHPRLRERAFALLPLLELAPDLVEPGTGTPLSSCLSPALLRQGVALHGEAAVA